MNVQIQQTNVDAYKNDLLLDKTCHVCDFMSVSHDVKSHTHYYRLEYTHHCPNNVYITKQYTHAESVIENKENDETNIKRKNILESQSAIKSTGVQYRVYWRHTSHLPENVCVDMRCK